VYLWIKDGKAELKDASKFWGMEVKETNEAIQKDCGDDRARIVCVGPAGENMVRFACVMSGLYDAFGRGGSGAVMGSKKLKAIAVRGSTRPNVVDPDRIKELSKWCTDTKLYAGLAEAGTMGTGAGIKGWVDIGNVPVRNFNDELIDNPEEADASRYRVKMDACFGCPVRCKKVLEVKEGPYKVNPEYGGPEYESIAALGPNCGIVDIRAISAANERCNATGMDTISTGMTIAFAMECVENGLITADDVGDIDLSFGNEDAVVKMVDTIAKREGIGDLLAEGTMRAATRIGRGAEEYAIHVKGLELPMHEPRVQYGLAVGYMVAPQGADHQCNLQDFTLSSPGWNVDMFKAMSLENPASEDGTYQMNEISFTKMRAMKYSQLGRLMHDIIGLCEFLPFNYQQMADMMQAITGVPTTISGQFRIAERVMTLFRLINLREGLTVEDDVLPERFYHAKSGPTPDQIVNKGLDRATMDWMRRYYYTLMGWDSETGIPLPETLEDMEI
jgi:aldehyde:ferredoxin oxidoreductase